MLKRTRFKACALVVLIPVLALVGWWFSRPGPDTASSLVAEYQAFAYPGPISRFLYNHVYDPERVISEYVAFHDRFMALGEGSVPELGQVLQSDHDPGTRRYVAEFLVNSGWDSSLPCIQWTLYNDPDPVLRRDLVRKLPILGASIFPDLERMIQEDADPEVRAAAKETLCLWRVASEH